MADEPLDDFADLPPDMRELWQAASPAQRATLLPAYRAYQERMQATRGQLDLERAHLADQQTAAAAELEQRTAAADADVPAAPAEYEQTMADLARQRAELDADRRRLDLDPPSR